MFTNIFQKWLFSNTWFSLTKLGSLSASKSIFGVDCPGNIFPGSDFCQISKSIFWEDCPGNIFPSPDFCQISLHTLFVRNALASYTESVLGIWERVFFLSAKWCKLLACLQMWDFFSPIETTLFRVCETDKTKSCKVSIYPLCQNGYWYFCFISFWKWTHFFSIVVYIQNE